ncbi:hypothetical protein EW146_g10015, partial [Bondarzewia mesenterica]
FPGSNRAPPTFTTLPAHILLTIVYHTFPQTSRLDEGRDERQRKTIYWLSVSLRLVNRALYIACMHVLRSTYLPAYTSLIRPPYTSDPFPLSPIPSNHPSSSSSPSDLTSPPLIPSAHRETTILDLFIALKVREDVWSDASELHLERAESFRDLFDLMQPRARCEDLVQFYGARAGLISPSTSISARSAIPFAALTVAFSPRSVGLVWSPEHGKGKRTIVQAQRARDEPLEVAAKKLVKELREWIAVNR